MIRLGGKLIGLFFLLMLVFPTSLQLERGLLLAIIFFGSVLILLRSPERWRVAKPIFVWLLITVWFSIFGIANGIFNSTPGAVAVGTVYVLWPILYVYFIGFSSQIKTYIKLEKILILGIAIAAVSTILMVSSRYFSFISILDPYFELVGGGVGVHDGYIESKLRSIALLVYGLPFLLTVASSKKVTCQVFSIHWITISYVVLLLSLISMTISGKRAFFLVFFLSIPLIMSIFYLTRMQHFSYKPAFKYACFFILITGLSASLGKFLFNLDYEAVISDFLTGFDFDDLSNIAAYRRAEQFDALISGWLDYPIIGAGHGAAASDKIGGSEMAWAYELQYIALLFQTGILGIFVYSSAVVWLIFQMVRLSRIYKDLAGLMVPALVGLMCFLVANATNPYLSKFDFLWVIFLPVGLVNVGLLREQNNPA